MLRNWTLYRVFRFSAKSVSLTQAHREKVQEMADYLDETPSLKLGLDARSGDLANRRVKAIRKALINAGLAADRIERGKFGDPDKRRKGRIAALLKSRSE